MRSIGTDAAIIVTAASALPQITSVTPSSELMLAAGLGVGGQSDKSTYAGSLVLLVQGEKNT